MSNPGEAGWRLEGRIRALELEVGLREWDERDECEARQRALATSSPEEVARFAERERRRLVPNDPGSTGPADA